MDSPQTRPKSPRRGAYVLPSFFTIANVFCGYLALTETFRAGQVIATDLAAAAVHFDVAAKAIGYAVLFDGLDGRLARLMGTSSAFGKEFDSLADTISFGVAPAFLGLAWGVRPVLMVPDAQLVQHLTAAGWLISFVFVISAAARLARFNLQSSAPATSPERKFFVGLPTPAAAGLVAAIIHIFGGVPRAEWLWVPFWLLLLLAIALLMVSTWRYYSFKELDLRRKRKFVVVLIVGAIFAGIWFYSKPVLMAIASTYLLSGVYLKLSQALRRNPAEVPAPAEEPSA
jgi:CDP-diacylglycerol--serine O-phosphatidyltransferase